MFEYRQPNLPKALYAEKNKKNTKTDAAHTQKVTTSRSIRGGSHGCASGRKQDETLDYSKLETRSPCCEFNSRADKRKNAS